MSCFSLAVRWWGLLWSQKRTKCCHSLASPFSCSRSRHMSPNLTTTLMSVLASPSIWFYDSEHPRYCAGKQVQAMKKMRPVDIVPVLEMIEIRRPRRARVSSTTNIQIDGGRETCHCGAPILSFSLRLNHTAKTFQLRIAINKAANMFRTSSSYPPPRSSISPKSEIPKRCSESTKSSFHCIHGRSSDFGHQRSHNLTTQPTMSHAS